MISYKIHKIILRIFFTICAFGQLALSCVRIDLDSPASTESYVVIHPVDHNYTLPGLKYHFYNKDMQTEYFTLSCDGRGTFSGYLPCGEYTVLATNTDATNVSFAFMDSHETAIVHIADIDPATRAAGFYLKSPDEVYSMSLEDLSVSGRDTLHYAVTPVLLTRSLILNFTLKGDLIHDVTGLSGKLNGLYRTIHLHSGQPTEESIHNSPDRATTFMADATDSNKWRSEVRLFGLHNPAYGDNYQSILHLELIFSSGGIAPLELELTNILSDVITQNQGILPMSLPLHIQIERTGIGLIASVVPWNPSGGGEVELPEKN